MGINKNHAARGMQKAVNKQQASAYLQVFHILGYLQYFFCAAHIYCECQLQFFVKSGDERKKEGNQMASSKTLQKGQVRRLSLLFT